MRTRWFLGWGVALFLVGCGDSGTGTGGGGGEGGGTGGSGGSGGEGPNCTEFDTAPPLGNVAKIRYENNTDAPLYFGAQVANCEPAQGFLVQNQNGENLKTSLATCELSCSAARTSGCECLAACVQPQVIQIAPGGSFETEWRAAIYEVGDMPVGCWNDQTCRGGGCSIGRAPVSGLTFEGFLFTELADCMMGVCDCTPSAEGNCIVEGATLVSGTSKVTTTDGWVPGETLVTLDFQPQVQQ